jgi:hypothetical protein
MPSDPPPWTQTGGRLDGVNGLFHASYDSATAAAEHAAPVLIFLGDQLILHRGGSRREARVTTPAWLAVRSAAHAPIAVFSLLSKAPGTTRIEELRSQIESALHTLPRELSDAEALADVQALLTATLRWLEHPDDLEAFARSRGADLLRLTDHATRLQLASLHARVDELLADFSPEELAKLQVVVAGAHQARDRSLGMQYFRKRLNEPPHEENRVAYAENAADEKAALSLAGIRKFDGAIASAFFGDPKRLQRDVLGDSVEKRLAAMTF